MQDASGRVVNLEALEGEAVEEGGQWTTPRRDGVATGLNPERLAALFRDAEEGELDAYLTLAEEMEERDLHYRAVIGQRRSVIATLTMSVEAVDETDEQVEIAAAVDELLREPMATDLVFDAMDAVGKGYAIVEILWETSRARWRPRGYLWRDPRYFRVDEKTMRTFRLHDGTREGRELEPYKFVIHTPKLKSGLPIRSGLARLAGIAYVFKAYTVRDCQRFLEAYGIPPRLGRYPVNTKSADRTKLLRAARLLGTDAAAIIPENLNIELLDGPKGASSESFLNVASWWDRQLSKAVLGQTSSSEGGAGDYKASSAHQGVRMDIASHDARSVAASVTRDLVRAFVDLNWGPQERYPRVTLPVPHHEDLTKFAAAVTPFIDRGLEVSAQAILDRLGIPPAKEGDVLLKPRVAGPQAPMGDAPGTQTPTDEEE